MTTIYPNLMLTPHYLAGVLEARPDKEALRRSYIGAKFFPLTTFPTRKFSWDVMMWENNLAGIYDPKGQAIPGDDVLFSTIFADLIDAKASRHLDPDIVMNMREPGAAAVFNSNTRTGDSIAANVGRHLRERMAWCDDAIDTQYEYYAMSALQGEIWWPPLDANGNVITVPMPHWNSGMPVHITYPIRAAFKQKASTLSGYGSRTNTAGQLAWSNANANPIQDLEIIAELFVKTTGMSLRGGTILMSEGLLSQFCFLTPFVNWVAGSNKEQSGARQFIDIEEIKTVIKTKLGFNIQLYDANWTYRTLVANAKPTITNVPFLADDKMIFLPPGWSDGMMGTTYLQQDPEGTRPWKAGKLPWSYSNPKPPFETEVGVNIVMFPLFKYYDWFIFNPMS